MVLDALQQTAGFQVIHNPLAGLEPIQAAIGLGRLLIQARVFIQHINQRQAVPLADLVIVEVVRRRDLDATGSEFLVDVVIRDDRDGAAGQRQFQFETDQVRVTLVARIDRDRGIAQQCFRTRGGDHHVTFAVGARITDVPELSVFLFRHDFEVGQGGVQHGVPVDQAFAAVDQLVVVEVDKHFSHRF